MSIMPRRKLVLGVKVHENVLLRKNDKKEHISGRQKMTIDAAIKCLKIVGVREARHRKTVPMARL